MTEPRRLVSLRDAAARLGISEQVLYKAKKRGTIRPATGADVPEGTWFEEGEFRRWADRREALRQMGRPPGSGTKRELGEAERLAEWPGRPVPLGAPA